MIDLAGIDAASLCIPFRVAFRHAAAERSRTATIWVEARSADGVTGYGEGCPRDYVTGETIDTALAFVAQVRDSLCSRVTDMASLTDWVSAHQQPIDENPAAWCALELALLDCIAKSTAQSVECMLGHAELSGEFQYSAVLGNADEEVFGRQLQQYSQTGFRDFKIKVSGDRERDRRRIAEVYAVAGSDARVRLDANMLWADAADAIAYVNALAAPVFALEEPLAAGGASAAAEVAATLGIPVILDEGFTRIEQITALAAHPQQWILNLRVSKLGGILRSLAVIDSARQAGLRIVIGAQVGETSLLTRAALTLANVSRDILLAQEGAFGTLLLEADVCSEPLMFGAGGRLAVGDKFRHQAGFGLPVDPLRLAGWGAGSLREPS